MNFKVYYIAFKTIVRTELKRFLRLWAQTLLPPIISMCLYFTIFGHMIGSKLPLIDNVTFMQFMAPGLIMMGIISHSFMNVVSSVYSLRFQRSIEEILVSPIPPVLILMGFCIGGILRGVTVGGLIAIVALFYTHLSINHLALTFGIVFVTSSLFSLAGFTNALFARSFDDITIVPTFILTPLSYFGGVFYSIHQLPAHWQFLSRLNPILYIVNAFRYSILGVSDIALGSAISICLVGTISLFIFNLYLLKKGQGIRS